MNSIIAKKKMRRMKVKAMTKEYVRISASAEGYYSGQVYEEEVFLPVEVWNEIEAEFETEICVSELDGKHSEVPAEVETKVFASNELETYIHPAGSGEELLAQHIYEHLLGKGYEQVRISELLSEGESISKVETLTIQINKEKKEELMAFLEPYIL